MPRTREAVDWWLQHWGRDGVVSGDESMSREDVERLISVNGGTATNLALDSRNLSAADLSEVNLRGANFHSADLGRSDLRDANLFGVDFQDADLFRADLRGAFLMQVNFQSAFLLAIRMDEQTNLEDINWGEDYISEWERIGSYRNARAIYRQLNVWHKNHGHPDIAGEFLYREWICKRLEIQDNMGREISWRHPWQTLKALNWRWWGNLIMLLWLIIHELLFGYGERPIRVVIAAVSVILGFGLFYFLFPLPELFAAGGAGIWRRLLDSLYFSLASFTTVGYGGWVEYPDNWLRYVGGLESFIGMFMTALFLVTFTRKWSQ